MTDTALLPPDILAGIVDRFGARPESSAGDYVRFPLRGCNATVHNERPAGGSDAFEIEIADLSMCGFGFRTRLPVADGTAFTVKLDVPGLRPQTWRCRVVSVHTFDGQTYRAGAKFEAIVD